MRVSEEQWGDLLRAHGFRATRGRIAILDAIHDLTHPTIDTIQQTCCDEGLALTTIYRALEALEQAGVIWAIHVPGRGRVYRLHTDAPQAQLICRRCGSVNDLTLAPGTTPGLRDVDAAAFTIDQVAVTGIGTCAGCLPAEDASVSG